MNKRRALLIAISVLLGALILAAAAQAGAGGGTSNFGGGGGGEGGGGGGGRGVGIYILFQLLFRIAILGHGLGLLIIIGAVLLYLLVTRMGPRARDYNNARRSQGRAARSRTAKRERSVELAAAEAAEDDPTFAPDVVRPAAKQLFLDIQHAWDARNIHALEALVAADLLEEWERRLRDFDRKGWRNHVQPVGEPQVEYVSLQNRGDRRQDRVVVRIEAKLHDYVEDASGRRLKRRGHLTDTVNVREFWTLGKNARGNWILISIEQGAEGAHALEEKLVASPWSDDQSLHDEAMIEQAAQDALPDDVKPAEVASVSLRGDARAAALDLSLADGRFAPDVLEIAARRAAHAWAQAVDGSDAALKAIATRPAIQELLHPGDPSERTRLVVRGPRVKKIRIARLDASANPPTMSIDVDLSGRRYIEERDTAAIISGSQAREVSFTERWVLELTGDAAQPWRIASAGTALVA